MTSSVGSTGPVGVTVEVPASVVEVDDSEADVVAVDVSEGVVEVVVWEAPVVELDVSRGVGEVDVPGEVVEVAVSSDGGENRLTQPL